MTEFNVLLYNMTGVITTEFGEVEELLSQFSVDDAVIEFIAANNLQLQERPAIY